MCCFSRPIKYVAQTRIFARAEPEGRQVLVYSMNLHADEELAMVLPLPVPVAVAEDAVRFISLAGYAHFFRDLEAAFPPMYLPRAKGGLLAAAAQPARPKLRVHSVGSFEASFVPTLDDFDRLDERFRLPPGVWDALPGYRDYGFAVFKLKPVVGWRRWFRKRQTIHPMAFSFPRRDPTSLFFPTVHVHDGTVPEEAAFDHSLYCQPDALTAATFAWTKSTDVLGRFVDADRAMGVVDGNAPAYRAELMGRMTNQDQTLVPPECSGLSVLEARGDLFVLKLKATWHYARGNGRTTHAWIDTASHGLDRLHTDLSAGLTALTHRCSGEWGLARYDEETPLFRHYALSLPPGFHVPAPQAERPCRIAYYPSNDMVEPQEIMFTFATPPSREVHARITAELQRLIDSVAPTSRS